MLAAVLLLVAGCGSAAATPTASVPADESVAGRYRLKSPNYEEDYDQALQEDYYLVLDDEGTAQFEAERIGDPSEVTVIGRGRWTRDGSGVLIEVDELSGQALDQPETIRYEYQDGFPVATDYQADGQLYNLAEAQYTIGAGERHPLVRELHQRLAAIDDLGFSDPGDDLFTEATRKAVVAFQESQGLLPNGEVGPATWVLLANPQPPLPTPTPLAPSAGAPATGVPDIDNLPAHAADGSPILYLTFDDGPSGYSQQMLDLLEGYGAEGTFFVLGKAVKSKPDLVRAMAEGGSYVANHTYSHTSLDGISQEDFMAEVEDTRQAILDAAGDLFTLDRDVRYMRPPYGAADANTRQYAADLGYAVVLWDIDPQDWRRPGAQVISGHVIREAYPGAVVLLHDGGGDRTQSVAALETILRDLNAQGYVFRNVFVP
ncbi:MAG: polysaccharide deacetylase family protein [Anaerolineae bacterium]|jgi:peptidoglycan/xylan/chitin deacetylase (PgdA/CDA1 family)